MNIQSQDFVSELPTASGPESWEGCSLQFIRHVAWDFQLLPTQTEHGPSDLREGSMMGGVGTRDRRLLVWGRTVH